MKDVFGENIEIISLCIVQFDELFSKY